MAYTLGGKVEGASSPNMAKQKQTYDTSSALFSGLNDKDISWMSHGDYISKLPMASRLLLTVKAALLVPLKMHRKSFGVQFHPEVNHTVNGTKMLHNFLYKVCGCIGDWTMGDYAQTAIKDIREKVGDGKVFSCPVRGVDSPLQQLFFQRLSEISLYAYSLIMAL